MAGTLASATTQGKCKSGDNSGEEVVSRSSKHKISEPWSHNRIQFQFIFRTYEHICIYDERPLVTEEDH